MSSIFLEPILPNLTKVSSSGEQLRDLWKLFTKVKDSTQGGRRLENLFWRLWYKSSTGGTILEGDKVASLLETWAEDGDNLKLDKIEKMVSNKPSKVTNTTLSDHNAAAPPTTPPICGSSNSNPLIINSYNSNNNTAIMLPSISAAATSVTAAPAIITTTPTPSLSSKKSFVKNSSSSTLSAAIAAAPTAPIPSQSTKAGRLNSQSTKGMPESNIANPDTSNIKNMMAQARLSNASSKSSKATLLTAATSSSSNASSKSTKHAAEPSMMMCKNASDGKKFFITDFEGNDSDTLEEEPTSTRPINDLASKGHPTGNSSHLRSMNPPPTQTKILTPISSAFCKIEPEIEPAPRISNLSNMLRAPRRGPQRINPYTGNNFLRPRSEDFLRAPQQPELVCESESLRRGLQLDRKPLFGYSLGYEGNEVGTSFSLEPEAW